jgi:2-oxo-4-hydroxy-4-carboxy-5-ureidoimidazoline decarboxylase
MDLEDFNRADPDTATSYVAPCVAISSFARTLVAGRPYPDLPAMMDAARDQAGTWTDAEVEGALADHPRIGERSAAEGASARMSAREQAGVDPADADVQHRLREGNRRYEERFGRIYLVRAAGRTAQEMLDLLEQRLANDSATELAVTRGQLAEIALLRLEGLLA